MKVPRGHSNVYVKEVSFDTISDRAIIPIEGGASVHTVRSLPPLALSKDEWKEIGVRMKWFSKEVR